MNSVNKIVCLPPVSIKNPYQHLMIQGLKTNKKLKIIKGFSSRHIGIILSALVYRPDYIHFDWINKYYLKKNKFLTILNIPWFYFQILFIKKILKINIVWTFHNLLPHDTKQIIINKRVQEYLFKQCKWIRVFSSLTVNSLVNDFGYNKQKIIVCPMGSFVNYYPNSISRFDARKKLKINDEKVFLYLGTIKPYKGLNYLINIFSKIKNKKIKLIIAGNSMNKKHLIELKHSIGDNTSITLINKFIIDNELQIFYNAADVVILPFNKIENSASTILAMGFAKTIIAPHIGVLPNVLINQKQFLYKNNLIEKINLAISSKYDYLAEIGLKNLEHINKKKWSDFSNFF